MPLSLSRCPGPPIIVCGGLDAKKVDVVFGHVALDDADIVIVADRPQQVSSPNRRPSVSTLRRYSVTHITCRWIQKTSDSWADTVSHAELTIDHRTAQS